MSTIISSGFLAACLTAATLRGRSRPRSCSPWAPLRPSATPNSTRCPCRSAVVPEGSADECTKTSPPSSRARKPYPLSESYHLTLPVGTRRPHVEEKELTTASDHATDRMLWAFLRLSVRDAGSQHRYRRVYVFCRFQETSTRFIRDPAAPASMCWAGPENADGPGRAPGRLGNGAVRRIRSPCLRRLGRRGPCPSPASPRSRPPW